jgi:hypothetical protein
VLVLSELYTSIPVQYLIETISDWTIFSITEDGFWWSDIEVECLKGEKKLSQDVVFSDKKIKVNKPYFDRSLVKIRVTCRLNIDEEHLTSNIRYLIEKGDIGYTIVRIWVKGREIDFLENKENISENSKNPKDFLVSIRRPSRRGIISKIFSWTYAVLKIPALFVFSYATILSVSYVYCYSLSVDFSEVARTNPYIFILGGVLLFASLVAIALKRNWV